MGDQDLDYIPAGVHEEIAAGLGGIAAVEMRGRSSVARYHDTDLSYPEIARELGVGGLLECSVSPVGRDSIRVRVSLLDALQDRQLWSDTYQRPAADVFLLGGDVALGVAEALQANVTPTESARVGARPTASQEALTHYHRGRYLMDRWTPEGIGGAMEHFERAIALDPTFALPYTGMAEALMLRGDLLAMGDIMPVEYMPRARELALKALEIDSELADGHGLLGWIRWYYDYDYAAGEREARLATELDSTSASAWDYYGLVLSMLGRDDEAIAAFRRAIELDPVTPWILSDFCWILLNARKYREVLEVANTAIELDPSLVPPYGSAATVSLLLGNHDAAIAMSEQADSLSVNPYYLGALGYTYASAGRREEALTILDSLMALSEQRYVAPRAVAIAYLGLDSLDAAIDWYMEAAKIRDPGVNMFIRNPRADALQDHPRYPELLRLMGLEN
jgi:serine/threonine-protein kinase